MKEKETFWLRRAVSPLHHEATEQKELMRTWRIAGSTRFQNLAVRSMIVFNSTPSGSKLVGISNRMGMKFARKWHVGGQVPLFYWLRDLYAATVPSPTVAQA
eukprot:1138148-Pelagomonas_calceolata.AAC.2